MILTSNITTKNLFYRTCLCRSCVIRKIISKYFIVRANSHESFIYSWFVYFLRVLHTSVMLPTVVTVGKSLAILPSRFLLPFSIPTPTTSFLTLQLAFVRPALFIHDDRPSQASKWSPCDEQVKAASREAPLQKAVERSQARRSVAENIPA